MFPFERSSFLPAISEIMSFNGSNVHVNLIKIVYFKRFLIMIKQFVSE